MLSKNKISEIVALQQKKFRVSSGLFIAEGEKIVSELIQSNSGVIEVYATHDLYDKYVNQFENIHFTETQIFAKLSAQKSPSGILAIVKQQHHHIDVTNLKNKITLCLDGVRDPGNLGTIIRIADWFGIAHIICSNDTVELYNPKVIQATMGSFMRVKLIYTALEEYLQLVKEKNIPIYGAILKGENIYQNSNNGEGIIILGSESHGISKTISKYIDKPITIPSKLLTSEQSIKHQPDSLNVAVACSIICALFAVPHNKFL
jgi:TrmH family RNA methyltransferase